MKILKYLKLTSILIIITGVIHVCATPVVIAPLKMLGVQSMLTHTYMFVFTGLALIFTGWLQYFVLKRLGNENSFHTIFKGTVIMISISGVGAVAAMWTNPFAYLILLIALYEIYLVKLLPGTNQ
jgi:hypothetical protein